MTRATDTKARVMELISTTLLFYREPAPGSLWGKQRTDDKARSVVAVLEGSGFTIVETKELERLKASIDTYAV